MLPLEACKRILNINGQNYSDDEILQIRDLLYEWIEIEYYHKARNSPLGVSKTDDSEVSQTTIEFKSS